MLEKFRSTIGYKLTAFSILLPLCFALFDKSYNVSGWGFFELPLIIGGQVIAFSIIYFVLTIIALIQIKFICEIKTNKMIDFLYVVNSIIFIICLYVIFT